MDFNIIQLYNIFYIQEKYLQCKVGIEVIANGGQNRNINTTKSN